MRLSLDADDEVTGVTINMGFTLTNKTMLLPINHAGLDLKLKCTLLIHQPVSKGEKGQGERRVRICWVIYNKSFVYTTITHTKL